MPASPVLTLPPRTGSLTEGVAAAVRDGVRSGELVAETTYSVYQLAELLGVSRSPVREALLRLSEAGLVEIVRNRGFRVLLPDARDLQEIFEVRLALEPAAARAVAERGTADDLRAIGDLAAAMAAAAARDDEASFWPQDRALHDRILRAAGNRRAASIVADLRSTTALLGPPTTASGRTLREIHAEHAPIVAAVLARDGGAAEAAMREHLRHTSDLLVAGRGG